MTKINESIRQGLKSVGFSDTLINIMELSPRMVKLLNEYKGEFKIRDDGLSGAYYSRGKKPEDDKIVFSNEYRNISTIAHELGHSIREYQPIILKIMIPRKPILKPGCWMKVKPIIYNVK